LACDRSLERSLECGRDMETLLAEAREKLAVRLKGHAASAVISS
jgi:hypothetical protein